MTCWSCQAPVPAGAAFCACGAIQPVDPRLDHFAVLGVERAFDLDASGLEKRYKDLTRKLHPDRFAKADPRARRHSLERATQVNDAYKVLRNPVRRAEYLLKLEGVDVADEQQGGGKVDPEFLMEMMEQREALLEARMSGDEARLAGLGQAMRTRRQGAMERVSAGFARGGLDEVAEALVALRYYDRFLDELEAHEERAHHA